jgi:hypothetical protein
MKRFLAATGMNGSHEFTTTKERSISYRQGKAGNKILMDVVEIRKEP